MINGIKLLAICLFAFNFGCFAQGSYQYNLKGDLGGVKYGKVYLLLPEREEDIVLDSAELDNGKFELRGTMREPRQCILQVNRRKFSFFMDGVSMEIVCPYLDLKCDYLEGSPANDLAQQYRDLVDLKILEEQNILIDHYKNALEKKNQKLADEWMTQILKLEDKRYALTKKFIQEHPTSIFSAYIANVVKEESYEKGKELYALLSDELRESYFGVQLKREVDALAVSALGVACPDFQVKNEEGNIVALSSLKGKILVLDFWASWCGPCRQEMQNLREQYAEFKDRGVQIMSISLDDSIDKWKQACEEERIPWISTHDENGWNDSEIRKLFGIQSIPFIVLLDENGNIVAKNIRRNLLREKIIELLDKK